MRILAACLMAILACPPLSADTLILDRVNIIDVATGKVLENRAVVVQDGRIDHITVANGGHGGARVIDGGNGWLMPGLAEMHAHVPSRDRGEQYAQDVLTLFLANGITTIRGMLGEPWHVDLRQNLAAGNVQGPRLITSGPSFNGRSVSSPEQGVERVRSQVAFGYDFLKIHPGLERAAFLAIAAAAKEAGIPIAGHVSVETGLEAALQAGQDCIDHLDGYAQEMLAVDSELKGEAPQWFGLNLGAGMQAERATALAKATADAGVAVVPTQSLFETTAGKQSLAELEARPGMGFLSDELAARWRGSVETIRERSTAEQRAGFLAARRALIRALQEAGAPVLLGSDAPQIMNVPGYATHQELEYMVLAGLTPLQALQTGTINVARYFGFDDQGQIAEGQIADLVLLDANPLEDISNTQAITGVMRGGKWYTRETLDRMLADVEKRKL